MDAVRRMTLGLVAAGVLVGPLAAAASDTPGPGLTPAAALGRLKEGNGPTGPRQTGDL